MIPAAKLECLRNLPRASTSTIVSVLDLFVEDEQLLRDALPFLNARRLPADGRLMMALVQHGGTAGQRLVATSPLLFSVERRWFGRILAMLIPALEGSPRALATVTESIALHILRYPAATRQLTPIVRRLLKHRQAAVRHAAAESLLMLPDVNKQDCTLIRRMLKSKTRRARSGGLLAALFATFHRERVAPIVRSLLEDRMVKARLRRHHPQ